MQLGTLDVITDGKEIIHREHSIRALEEKRHKP
jgi:hypothetical protein